MRTGRVAEAERLERDDRSRPACVLFSSDPMLFFLVVSQVVAIVSVMVFSFVVTFVIAKVLDAVMGIRVTDEEEITGLDQTQHAESAYVD